MEQKDKSNLTRQRILDVAARLFLEKGFNKTTMRDIVEQLNMSKGAIYHHFKSKDEIINEVYRMQEECMHNQLSELQEHIKEQNGRDKICSILKHSVEEQKNQTVDEPMSNFVKSADYILKYMKDNVSKNAPIICALIEEGNKDKSLSCQYSEEISEAFLLLLNIWCDPAIFDEDKEKVHRKLKFVQTMMKMFGADVLEDDVIDVLCKL